MESVNVLRIDTMQDFMSAVEKLKASFSASFDDENRLEHLALTTAKGDIYLELGDTLIVVGEPGYPDSRLVVTSGFKSALL